MGIGPVVAIPKALALAGLKMEDIGVIELNEAFARAGAGRDSRGRSRSGDASILNGGAIALGIRWAAPARSSPRPFCAKWHRRDTRIRHGHHVRRRRPGRCRHFRKSEVQEQFRWQPTTISPTKHQGRLVPDRRAPRPNEIFTPEDFTEEHRAIARTTEEFWTKEIAPNVEAIQHQEPGVAVSDAAQSRRTRPHRRHHPRKIRRHGNGSDLRHGGGRRTSRKMAPTRPGTARTAGIGALPLSAASAPKSRSSTICPSWRTRKWSPPTA